MILLQNFKVNTGRESSVCEKGKRQRSERGQRSKPAETHDAGRVKTGRLNAAEDGANVAPPLGAEYREEDHRTGEQRKEVEEKPLQNKCENEETRYKQKHNRTIEQVRGAVIIQFSFYESLLGAILVVLVGTLRGGEAGKGVDFNPTWAPQLIELH